MNQAMKSVVVVKVRKRCRGQVCLFIERRCEAVRLSLKAEDLGRYETGYLVVGQVAVSVQGVLWW